MKIIPSLVFTFLGILTACGDSNISTAKKAIEANLKDPSSVQYKNITVYSEDVVCGEFNAKNSLGGYTGFSQFIYNGARDGEAEISPTAQFEAEYFCNNTPKKRIPYFEKILAKQIVTLKVMQGQRESQKNIDEWKDVIKNSEIALAELKARYDKK